MSVHPFSRAIIERTPQRLRRPVALTMRTTDAAMADRLPGMAAELAFWVLLSLPALVLSAVAAAGVLLEGQEWQGQLIAQVVDVASVALTQRTIDGVIVPVLEQIIEGGRIGIVSFAFVAAVWTASRAVKVVLVTLAIVYGREQHRRPWQDRLLGFAITIGGLLLGSVIAPLLIAGPAFGEQLDSWLRTDLSPLPELWRVMYWPTVIIVATLALAVLYHLGVPGRTRWQRDLPGAILATAVWLAGSAGLRLYGAYISGTESVYGPLAGPIVALLWLWLTGFAALLGGELNAQIDQVYPVSHLAPSDEALLDDRSPPGQDVTGVDPDMAPGDTEVTAIDPPATEAGQSDPTVAVRTTRGPK